MIAMICAAYHLPKRLMDVWANPWFGLIEHKQYIREYGEDMPEIRNWNWGALYPGKPA